MLATHIIAPTGGANFFAKSGAFEAKRKSFLSSRPKQSPIDNKIHEKIRLKQ
jgi:hypothetical protein